MKRLSKIAKELNVGISTIVEFLEDKGEQVDANPNAKVTQPQYEILLSEFSDDKTLKKEADKFDLDKLRSKKESLEVDLPDFIPSVIPQAKTPNILGKIDIEPKKTKKNKDNRRENKKEVATKGADEQTATKKPKTDEQKVEDTAQQEKKEEVTRENRVIDSSENLPTPKNVETKQEVKENEIFSPNKEIIKDTTKVLGKIDLGALNLKTRPAKKTKEERAAEESVEKKKRKRIRREKVDIKPKTNNKKPKQLKKPVAQEISSDEVQKQLKKTLSEMGNRTKSRGAKHRREKRDVISQKTQVAIEQQEKEKRILKITEFITANELSTMMDISVNELIATCMSIGLFISINQRLDSETIEMLAQEFGYDIDFVDADSLEEIEEDVDQPKDLLSRPPIVTIMGHVDHGKTSLLDYIRKTNVIGGEAGGITQHIGAYKVELDKDKDLTFLDTPGHEAFTAMRARGAKVTDIAIIVIAADDKIMPQTEEAIHHAQAAGVPIVFAINKVDRPNANPDKIKEELAQKNFLVEEWNGKYQSQDISAKTGEGVPELLEKVLLEAEMLELKANPNKKATGTIIESTLDKGRGYVTTLLVSGGTLKMGDIILAGSFFGTVKAMFNERNAKLSEVKPSEPALVLGLNGAPQAGDKFYIVSSDKEAREISTKRQQLLREQGIKAQKQLTLDELGRRIAVGNFKELNIIIKGDMDGSVEALGDSLVTLSTEEIQVRILHKAIGAISESDVMLASASDAIIIGFQVRPSLEATKLATKENIEIRLYSIIYQAVEEVKAAMEGMLSPEEQETINATLEVRETFKIPKVGMIAGCMVREGKIKRSSKLRVIRDGIVIYEGVLGSLKRFKEDVKEVDKGYECGLNIENFNDLKVGDNIEAYSIIEVAKKL